MTISRQALFGKLGATLYRGVESATSFCKLRGNPYVELVHWLHQLLQITDSDLHRIIRHAGIERDALDRDMVRALSALPAGASSISDFSHHIELAIERAWVFATPTSRLMSNSSVMKRIFPLCIGIVLISSVSAAPDSIRIGPIPLMIHGTPMLEKSLEMLRMRIDKDAQECIDNARGMDAYGTYEAELKKTVETSQAVVLEVSGTMMCDGVHSSSYRYAIGLNSADGKRIDLNSIYNVGIRENGHLFLRHELIDIVKKSYRQANESNPPCLNESGWKDDLLNYPITISPLPDGGITLYYSVPDVEAACFPILKIERRELAPYRNAKRATEFSLP